jgi:cytochrome c biogenesis protein CcmG, thiol:disulfide interchange protein DsbE
MTEINTSPAPRRSVPVWAQIIIWVGLLGLLGVVALKLFKAQQPMLKVGAGVPDFTLPFYDGYGYNGATEVKLSSLHGKVVMINFWASWCIPCEQEAADLQKAWEAYQPGGEVIFLGIDYVDTPLKGAAYLQKFSITYPNGPDVQESISPIFNRNMGVPETYFIDRTGNLRHIQIGPFISVAEIKAIIDPLLAEK